jgi:3-oxoacyl-[acyl-carrier protein] reductase
VPLGDTNDESPTNEEYAPMVTVIETWFLTSEFADQALKIMQDMDDLVGHNAHDDPGWCGHAHFYQRDANPNQVIMMYSWRSIDKHKALCLSEKPMLQDFMAKYCERERTIEYLTELPVDVDHDR